MSQVWFKLAQWFWRTRFFNYFNAFYLFRNYLPWKGTGPFIWTHLNPLHPRMHCAKFGWNWPRGSGEEDENVKSLQTDGRTDRQTDDGRQVIKKAHSSFQLRWAKNQMCVQTLLHVYNTQHMYRFSVYFRDLHNIIVFPCIFLSVFLHQVCFMYCV